MCSLKNLVTPYIPDCVLGELEKMGQRFKLALKIIKDNRFQRLSCSHKGIYADDCIVQRVTQVSVCKVFSKDFSTNAISSQHVTETSVNVFAKSPAFP